MTESYSGASSDSATMRSPELEPKATSKNAIYSTYLPAFVLALGTGIAVPAIPTLAKSFGVEFGAASGIITAFLLGNLVGTLPCGWLIDHFGRRPIMIAGPLLTALMAFLCAFAFSFQELLLLRFLDGFAAQMWLMGRLAAISQGSAPRERGKHVSWMFGMNNTGALAGPIMGGMITSIWGARSPFIVFGALALVSLLPTLFFADAGGRRTILKSSEKSAATGISWKEIILPRLPYFGVALFAGLTRGPIFADLLHLYAAFAYHLGPQQIGYLATGAALLAWPIGFLAGWMMDRYGRLRTMIPGFGGVALSMAALGVSTGMGLGLDWYIVLFFIAVILQALTGGSIQTVGADVAPPEARGRFLGVWRFVGQGGATLSPMLFVTLARLDYGASFLFISICAVAVVGLLIKYVPETRE
ncbi:MFS transporter [Rhizobium sp. BK376]|uniref:MFS transporter n=1 Tax=Rhizobium sp. BK376 TaxID=2512149 RepID=UPI001046FA87|nr:MFS transporter [Rhizobium sp. BK376]TCR87693.1 putative MFS family arabinose efflux permease [Rhizobium sp. BK376]